MKRNLKDVTFCILIRLDSIQRLENILFVTQQLCKYFNTNVIIREADKYNNGILKKLLNKKIYYEFIEDKDPVLYKTKHINQMTLSVNTRYLAIWDVDIVPDKKAIIKCVEELRSKKSDIAYPYKGVCYDLSEPIKSLYLKRKRIEILFKHKNKMDLLYNQALVGGAVILNKEKYIKAGCENEKHYGWGNDDFDRYYRFVGLDYKIFRVDVPLFHLPHPRGKNSTFRSLISERISSSERFLMKSNSKEELYNLL